jgi:arylsulfatase A-like enzyme
MRKKILFLLSIILFLSFCSKSHYTISYDLIAEFPLLKKISAARTIRPIESWDKNYGLYGWRKNRNFEKFAVLIPRAKQRAFFRLGFLNKKDKKIIITVKPLLSPNKNTPLLNIFLNGNKIYTLPFNWEGFRKISIPAREDHLYIGENFLELHLSPDKLEIKDEFWLALREIRIDEEMPLASSQLAQEQVEIITRKSLFSKKKAIKQALNTSLNYCLKIPKRAKLTFNFSLETPNPDSLSGEKFLVYLETAAGESQILYEKDFEKGFSKKKIPVETDISVYQDQISKISFVFLKDSLDRNFSARLFLWAPRILFKKKKDDIEEDRGPELNLQKPFNILIYLVDCLRPDHLPFFNYKKNVAPHMDKFSKDSIIFNKAFAQGSWTRPSVGALFTGLHPFAHRAITLKSGLASELTTLAEVLEKAGYYTIGVSSNAGIKQFFNFHQGFKFFKYHSNLDGGISDKLNEHAISELKKKRTPFFLFLHTMDLHRPYRLKEEFHPSTPEGGSDKDRQIVTVIKDGGMRYQVDLKHVLAMYDAAIQQNDKSFGDLIEELKKLDLYDNTLIILTADHGEELYDHKKFAHGKTLYQEVINQLLVIKLPGKLMAGKVIQENIQTIDIFPTFLDLIGEPIPSYLFGKSLKNLIFSPPGFESPFHDEIFTETGKELRLKAVIDGNWKLIRKTGIESDKPEKYELFNLKDDPSEKNNLFYRNPIASEYLKRRMQNWAQSQEKLAKLVKGDVEKILTKKEIEELKALGYIQ